GRRHGGRERKVAGVRSCYGTDYAPHHAHNSDDRTSKFSTPASSSDRRASRLNRGRRSSPLVRQAARLRRHTRRVSAAGNHHQECRDLDRSNRSRKEPRKGRLASRRRCQRSPFPPDHVDGRVHGSRVDPNRANRILGADGLRNYGRFAGGDYPHPSLPTDTLCNLVWRQGRFVPHLRTAFFKFSLGLAIQFAALWNKGNRCVFRCRGLTTLCLLKPLRFFLSARQKQTFAFITPSAVWLTSGVQLCSSAL